MHASLLVLALGFVIVAPLTVVVTVVVITGVAAAFVVVVGYYKRTKF